MSLGSDLAAHLPELRAQAVSRMTETVVAGIYEITNTAPLYVDVRTLTTSFYTGPARVKYPTLTVSDPVAGSQQFAVADIEVHIPSGSPLVPVGAEFTVQTSTADGLLVGRVFRVKGAPNSGQTTAHRYPVTEQL